MILNTVYSDSWVTYESLSQDDPKTLRPDISKGEGVRKWEP